MTPLAPAVASALAAIAAALLFAIRARDAALREAERLRGIFRAEEREREELRRRARAAEATAREWSDRASRARCELAEADRAIVALSNELDVLRNTPHSLSGERDWVLAEHGGRNAATGENGENGEGGET